MKIVKALKDGVAAAQHDMAMNVKDDILRMGKQARDAAHAMVRLSTRKKNKILEAMADELDAQATVILAANDVDMKAAAKANLSPAMLDRLRLTPERIEAMSHGLRHIAGLKDPVGEEISRWMRPNGLAIIKTRVPVGVVGIIYESRPNVTADAAAICLKTSNAVILRGGKESFNSNRAIARALIEGGTSKGMPEFAIQLVQTTDRKAVNHLIQMDEYVDMIIPRGGETLIRAVAENARVPVLKHYKGVCHVYVDADAEFEMAKDIVINAKCQRPGVCNAMETLLVHKDIANRFLPIIADELRQRDVKLIGDVTVEGILRDVQPAKETDWFEEYLDLVLAIRVVDSVEEAIEHINHYGSHHSDAIITQNESAWKMFTRDVDSATVYVNASTRFTDGGEFGMGAEMGISTDKLHARGPVGLEEMTTYKYIIHGKGQTRS